MPSPQVYEVVRPLVSLLDTQRDGLQNYEALLGLTNLSGRSDKLRYAGRVDRERLIETLYVPCTGASAWMTVSKMDQRWAEFELVPHKNTQGLYKANAPEASCFLKYEEIGKWMEGLEGIPSWKQRDDGLF